MAPRIADPQTITQCPDCGAAARHMMADYERNMIKCLVCGWWAWIHDPRNGR